ncbi:MAG: vanadium nitrogenase [Lachnospiraceae bacterium]|nr:vanadium nitrogenase [Lachnospiraceae bacterium]
MIAFINTFLSYVLVVIVFMTAIVAAVILGKKLRDMKDKKKAEVSETAPEAQEKA